MDLDNTANRADAWRGLNHEFNALNARQVYLLVADKALVGDDVERAAWCCHDLRTLSNVGFLRIERRIPQCDDFLRSERAQLWRSLILIGYAKEIASAAIVASRDDFLKC